MSAPSASIGESIAATEQLVAQGTKAKLTSYRVFSGRSVATVTFKTGGSSGTTVLEVIIPETDELYDKSVGDVLPKDSALSFHDGIHVTITASPKVNVGYIPF